MHLDQLLPPTSFLPFTVQRVRAPAVEWTNTALTDAASLRARAWCVPLPQDEPGAYLPEQAIALAERYGGHGLGGNGGGARCGLVQDVQIKGIGRNLLAAPETDFFHSYGGASINEGIYEALWGELLHAALPHGAVRVLGLVTTGTRVPLVDPAPGQDPTTARVLIYRQAALRPAHFMRSPFHQPAPDLMCPDPKRTVAAIAGLGAACAALYGTPASGEPDAAFVRQALGTMLERFADQIAAARAKRVMHGSLIASNIALDGRWLDFATTSAMPDYGHIVSPRGPDFLREELMLQPGMADLAFYLRKYLAPGSPELFAGGPLWAHLSMRLASRLPVEFAKLTGIPADLAEQLPGTAALFDVMGAITRRGNDATYIMLSDRSAAARDVPPRTGTYSLNAILRTAAFCADEKDTDAALCGELDDAPLRQRFVHAYWALRREAEHRLRARGRFGRLFIALNAARLNADNRFLYRTRLYDDIERALLAGQPVTALLSDTLRRGMALLADDAGGSAGVCSLLAPDTAICVREGLRIGTQHAPLRAVMPRAAATLSHWETEKILAHEAEILATAPA